jgi:hypothetical protein
MLAKRGQRTGARVRERERLSQPLPASVAMPTAAVMYTINNDFFCLSLRCRVAVASTAYRSGASTSDPLSTNSTNSWKSSGTTQST